MDLFDIYFDSVVGFRILESEELLDYHTREEAKRCVIEEFNDLDGVTRNDLESGYIGMLSVSNNDKIVVTFKDKFLE